MYFGDFYIIPVEQNWFNVAVLANKHPHAVVGFEISVGKSKISYISQNMKRGDLEDAVSSPNAVFVSHDFDPETVLTTLNEALLAERNIIFSINILFQ